MAAPGAFQTADPGGGSWPPVLSFAQTRLVPNVSKKVAPTVPRADDAHLVLPNQRTVDLALSLSTSLEPLLHRRAYANIRPYSRRGKFPMHLQAG